MTEIKILYLEDETTLGSITHDVLQKNGFQVEWVQDGRKAITFFQAKPFDLCIVDIMMPGKDGYSFVKEVRATNKDIPIIFLSARTLTEDVVKGFETGGDDFLKKPFSIEELIVRIRSLLRRSLAPLNDSGIFKLGNFTYNYNNMELALGDKVIQLTNRTNELLYRLAKHTGSFLDREQALNDIWGGNNRHHSRSMDVFVSKIRKYLEDDPNVSIVNVRGYGYRLVVKK